MKKLMVSHNCGITYRNELESESLDELLARAKQPDMDWLRWYIEEEDGSIAKHYCKIHRGIFETLGVILEP